MCKCTPEIKTPFCGKGDCQWPEAEDIAVTRIEATPNEINIEMKPPMEMMLAIADGLANCLKAANAKNFLTMTLNHKDLGKLSLTLQRVPGRTPEEELADLRAKIKLQEEELCLLRASK